MLPDFLPVIVILFIAALASVVTRRLTIIAGSTGFVVGLLVFAGAGYTGIAMLAVFFILGTAATSLGIAQKHQKGLAEHNKGKRTAGQVIANAGAAAMLGLLVMVMPGDVVLLRAMMAASFASATADTLSSELGNLYGKKFYNIITLRRDTRGLDGVISLEGTILGVVGSVCIALVYSIGYNLSADFLLIIITGTIGNLFDSILGATLERRNYLTNNVVNFLNTAIAAAVVWLLHLF